MNRPLTLTALVVLTAAPGFLSGEINAQEPDLGDVTESHVMIPMRDGVRLSAYLYTPADKGPWPVVFEQRYASLRSRSARKGAANLAAEGFVVALVNYRGTHLSEGHWVGYRAMQWGEVQDGYDTCEWLAKQSWSTGKVGTFGSSQGGYAQNYLAVTEPPHLVCQYMVDTGLSLFHEGYRIGGTTRPERFKGMDRVCRDPADNRKLLAEWFAHPHYDEYWQAEDCTRHFDRMNVPCMTIGSWYDFMNQGSIASFIGRQHKGGENSRGYQQLLIGPWLHGRTNKGNRVGELVYPENSIWSVHDHMVRWFNHHLKGQANGTDKDPTVRYYVMGAVDEERAPGNEWRTATDFPPRSTPVSMYLQDGGGLSATRPTIQTGKTEFVSDPRSPMEIPGRSFPGARDARGFEGQKQVRTFTTEPLKAPVEWTGRVQAELLVSSTAPDTDFIVRISDVYPDGRSILIVDYPWRARYREGFDREVMMEPGRTYPIRFPVGWMSQIFNTGHRIRVTISSTGAPLYEPNPQNGKPLTIEFPDEAQTATNTIHHSAVHASRIIAPVAASSDETQSESNCRVLPKSFNSDKKQQMMRSWLRRQVHEALDRRLEELETALKSREQIGAYQQKRKDFLQWTLGDMPPRSPLKARVTGTIQEDGFTIEKVLFESQPGFHVTANIYRPVGDGPFPAVLHPVGHSENGKAYREYQKANRLLVQNGFVVLCYDPIGQGERKQFITSDGKTIQRASGEHQQLGVAPILLGQCLGSYMVWDGVRAIDYLCSRLDVDPKRIGCTGISGGGNLTSYLMAFDDRIVAAAPGCFMTTHRRKNESPGPGDAEQNLFAQIRDGFDHPDFILSRAPKPTLILAATDDFVPIEGTWEAFRQAKRVYSKLGFPERIQLVEASAKHGFGRQLREAAVRFMARWLQGRHITVQEDEQVPVLPDEDLQVTHNGQVRMLPGSRSMFDLFAAREKLLAAQRPQLTREVIRDVTGIRPLKDLPIPNVDQIGPSREVETPATTPYPRRLVFHPEPGIVLPALHWPFGNAEPILIAPSDGMNSVVTRAEQLNAVGHPILIVEARDTGETRTRNWRFFGADYYIAYMLGRCWLGMQSEDLLVTAHWFAKQSGSSSIELIADGYLAPAALHTVALEPELITDVSTMDGLTTWQSLMTHTDAHSHLHATVPGALKFYDLPDLHQIR